MCKMEGTPSCPIIRKVIHELLRRKAIMVDEPRRFQVGRRGCNMQRPQEFGLRQSEDGDKILQ